MRSDLPNVILLNGASSAGKTTLAMLLQERLSDPCARIGVDDFLPVVPRKLMGQLEGFKLLPRADGTVPLHVGSLGRRFLEAFHCAVRGIASAELTVIVDDVVLDPRLLSHWIATLRGLDVFFVGVRCELAELRSRERRRPDRAQGHAETTHQIVHAHGDYDLEIDTTRTPASGCVEQVLESLRIRTRPSAFERLAARTSDGQTL